MHPGVVDAYLRDALPPRKLRRRYKGLSVAESRTLTLLKTLHAQAEPSTKKTRSRAPRRAPEAVASTAVA